MTFPIGPAGGPAPGGSAQPAAPAAQPHGGQGSQRPSFQQQLHTGPAESPGAPPGAPPSSPATNQDLFARFDHIRAELTAYTQRTAEIDKLVAEGKLRANDPKVLAAHRDEMRQLLFFQSEMQGAAMKVEIASKVVEHGTSGVKTVLQTQA